MPNAQAVRTAVVTLGLVAAAACSGKPNYKLSTDQINELKLAQKDALIVQMQFNQVQNALAEKMKAFNDVCTKIKVQQGLPDNATCDINNPGTVIPPAQPAAPEKKK